MIEDKIITPQHSSISKMVEIAKSTDVGDALIATEILEEYRKVTPKRVLSTRTLLGVNPAAEYFLTASFPVPDGYSYHIHSILHNGTQGDPNILGCTNIIANMFVLIDLEPIAFSEITTEISSVAAALAYEFADHKVIPTDFYAAEGTIISILQYSDYVGGGALARLDNTVVVLGDLIELSEDLMGRGTGQTVAAPGATTAAIYAAVGIKFAL